jgi:hypothetical protein
MPFLPQKKATLLIPSGPRHDPERKHLWIILTDQCPLNAHLIVSVCTIRIGEYHDPSCVIEAGEHPRIKEKSYVLYRLARAERHNTLINGEAAWLYQKDETVSDALFERVCAGVAASEHIPIRMLRYFNGRGSAF